MVRTVSDQALDDILGTLQLSPDEKLRLAHRLLADVAQARALDADSFTAKRLTVFMAGVRNVIETDQRVRVQES